MSDPIQHECGIALVRLKRPLDYYQEKYGTPLWGFYRLFLLMEKQHNRGQDGAGIGAVKLDVPPGRPYMFRERSIKNNPLDRIFRNLVSDYERLVRKGEIFPEFVSTVKERFPFAAEAMLGHLRYGTFGGYSQKRCHPYFRKSNWPMRNLMLAGNFNMTNTNRLNEQLIARGQHPIFDTDTQTILEEICFHLDEEHDRLFHQFRDREGLHGIDNARRISDSIDPARILRAASENWDGGYAIAGLMGNGDAFAIRDPWGIRPFFFFEDDDVVAMASERAPLMTVFQKDYQAVREIAPGSISVIKSNGRFYTRQIREPREQKSCTFERIYFSRGNDRDIYRERKRLGENLVPQILEEIDGNLEDTVFSYIPNTSEVAFYGMMQGLRAHHRRLTKEIILERAREGQIDEAFLDQVIGKGGPRSEKVANKDIKLRTFISQEKGRSDLVSHVYDISYGTIQEGDILVCLDDSIVRGTTLRQSIVKMLSRLRPRKIVIASTAPQIRYPDCYGIDMSELEKFIAFQAAVELVREKGLNSLLGEVYEACLKQKDLPPESMENHVRKLFEVSETAEISERIATLLRPSLKEWDGELSILFQTIENLHEALPKTSGDWYFTGTYPTPGGYKALNKAYINYFEKRSGRSY